MKIKLQQLVASNAALENFFMSEMPISISFKVGDVIEEVRAGLMRFDEMRDALIKKYGKLQEDGTYLIPTAKRKLADKEMEDILNTEIEISSEPISIEKLGDIKTRPVDMSALKWLLTS